MTDQVLISGNVARRTRAFRVAAPIEGVIIEGNIIRRSADARDSGDPEVDPSAGEGQGE